MSKWCGTACSNYFKVRDNKSFSAFMKELSNMIAHYNVEDNTWWIRANNHNNGGFDWTSYAEDCKPNKYVNTMYKFASYLQEREVAIFIEIGIEKLRYVTGNAVAIAWTGEITKISLADIYELVVKKYDIEPCRAEY